MDDIQMTKMEYPDEYGGMTLHAKSPAFAAIAEGLVKFFKESKGVNYCEWRLNGPDDFGPFTIHMHRNAGKTVAMVNGELRNEIKELKEKIDALKFFARHAVHCDSFGSQGMGKPCSCGLDKLLHEDPKPEDIMMDDLKHESKEAKELKANNFQRKGPAQ